MTPVMLVFFLSKSCPYEFVSCEARVLEEKTRVRATTSTTVYCPPWVAILVVRTGGAILMVRRPLRIRRTRTHAVIAGRARDWRLLGGTG